MGTCGFIVTKLAHRGVDESPSLRRVFSPRQAAREGGRRTAGARLATSRATTSHGDRPRRTWGRREGGSARRPDIRQARCADASRFPDSHTRSSCERDLSSRFVNLPGEALRQREHVLDVLVGYHDRVTRIVRPPTRADPRRRCVVLEDEVCGDRPRGALSSPRTTAQNGQS